MDRKEWRVVLVVTCAVMALIGTLGYRSVQTANDISSVANWYAKHEFTGYAAQETTVFFPDKASDVYITASTACSVAVTQNPTLVSASSGLSSYDWRKVIAAAADTFPSYHAYSGTVKVDTTYISLGADESMSLDLGVSAAKIKVASGTPVVRIQATGVSDSY